MLFIIWKYWAQRSVLVYAVCIEQHLINMYSVAAYTLR